MHVLTVIICVLVICLLINLCVNAYMRSMQLRSQEKEGVAPEVDYHVVDYITDDMDRFRADHSPPSGSTVLLTKQGPRDGVYVVAVPRENVVRINIAEDQRIYKERTTGRMHIYRLHSTTIIRVSEQERVSITGSHSKLCRESETSLSVIVDLPKGSSIACRNPYPSQWIVVIDTMPFIVNAFSKAYYTH